MWNPEYTNITTNLKAIRKDDVHGRRPVFIEIFYTGTSSTNATEIGAAGDAAKDGTTTPFKVNVVSSSANDADSAAKHVRKVRIMGVSVPAMAADSTIAATTGTVNQSWANGMEQYTLEEVAMNGTTDVYSQRFWIRVMGFYACEWGSGGTDAAGNITLEAPANTALFTIAAAANESQGGKIFGCYGHSGRLTYLKAGANDVAFNNT
jgi:hypothetical protein